MSPVQLVTFFVSEMIKKYENDSKSKELERETVCLCERAFIDLCYPI